MKKQKMLLSAGILMLFLIVSQLGIVAADGGYFPHPGYWVMPGEQRAVIFYEKGVETMIVTSGFKGNATDLVWIIPTPTKPEITKADEKVFENAAKLAQPVYDGGFRYGAVMELASGAKQGIGVEVIESKKVDYYDVNVLEVTSSDDLVTWFNANNYAYPTEYEYVLRHYVKEKWYFTAIKISPEAQGAIEVTRDLRDGHPTPLKMVFSSDKIVFPLKISSIEFKPSNNEYYYDNYVPIQLYVFADGKYEAQGFNTLYGNWVTKGQIEKLGNDDEGNPYIEPAKKTYYLTSLNAYYQKSMMDDDVFLMKSEDNKKVNAGPETWELFLRGLAIGVVLFIAWAFSPIGIVFIAGTFILFLSANKTARKIAWVIEFISLVLFLAISIAFLAFAAGHGGLDNYVAKSFIITCIIIIFMKTMLMISQAKYRKQLEK